MALNAETLEERLKRDLRAAMKARDTIRVATLRSMISSLDNATAVQVDTTFVPMEGRTPDVPRREVSAQEQLDILAVEAAGRRSAMLRYQELDKATEAERLRAELAVFAAYIEIDTL